MKKKILKKAHLIQKKTTKGHSTQWALYKILERTCSYGFSLREGILPLSVLALLSILRPFSIKILLN
jgi:hypothetical protein